MSHFVVDNIGSPDTKTNMSELFWSWLKSLMNRSTELYSAHNFKHGEVKED